MNMRSLLDITQDIEALDNLIADVDLSIERAAGEVTPEIDAALKAVDELREGLGVEMETKVDNLAAYIRMLKARAAIRTEEMERLKMRARIDEDNAAWLSDMLKGEMVALQTPKMETRRFKVSVAKNGGKTPLLIPQHLKDVPTDAPPEYVKTLTQHVLLTDKMREDLEAGKEIPGVALGERGTHLSIR
jgi:hypothetical protein